MCDSNNKYFLQYIFQTVSVFCFTNCNRLFLSLTFQPELFSSTAPVFYSVSRMAILSRTEVPAIRRVKIIYYIADRRITSLRSASYVSDNIAVPFASLRSLILLLSSSSFAFFDSLLRSSWDARLTSRITDMQSHTHIKSVCSFE